MPEQVYKPKKSLLYFRGIPQTRKDKFKGQCGLRGEYMQDVIEALMMLYLENPDCIRTRLKEIRERRNRP